MNRRIQQNIKISAPRFKPGTIIKLKYEPKPWEILFCFRTKEQPQEWLYYLMEVNTTTPDIVQNWIESQLPPKELSQVIDYTLHRNSMEAIQKHIQNFYLSGNGMAISNQELILRSK